MGLRALSRLGATEHVGGVAVAAGAFQEIVGPSERVMVGLPPSKSSGAVKFDRVFLSLASDFEGARVRLAIGKPGAFTVEDNLAVPSGRSVVRELKQGDEVASVIHQQGQPVAVLVEYQGL
jgi:hypothetical protein